MGATDKKSMNQSRHSPETKTTRNEDNVRIIHRVGMIKMRRRNDFIA